MKYKPNCCS